MTLHVTRLQSLTCDQRYCTTSIAVNAYHDLPEGWTRLQARQRDTAKHERWMREMAHLCPEHALILKAETWVST